MPQEIKTLNDTVWATIAPSKIHGVGVFAIRDIPKGQKLQLNAFYEPFKLTDFTGLLPEIYEIIKARWPYAMNGTPFLHPHNDVRLVSFMNHAADPNYDYMTDCVLRDVKAGDELTEDYGDMAP